MEDQKQHQPLIRTIYLYLFTIIGLILLVIGGVRFLNMGLKAFVFKQAERQEEVRNLQPPMAYQLDRIKEYSENKDQQLSKEEINAIKEWLADYEQWKTANAKINSVTAGRHRESASSLAFLLAGLPLYLYHWSVIKKETRKG